ncbi:MAG: hypothetical protein QM500_04925 [Methylococcales bacterium]
MSEESAQLAAKELSTLFPKTEKEPVYSVGFTRWMKLSLSQKKALMIRHNFNQQLAIEELANQ